MLPGLTRILRATLVAGLALQAQTPMETGPFPTRDMFPLYLLPMVYQPVDPTPLGEGRWRVSLDHIRANTFEFSDIFKHQEPRDAEGRVAITRDFVLAHAAEYASLPLVFYFDEEVARTTLRVRYGLGPRTDLWAELPFQSHGGGYLDQAIEQFHKLGFKQFGRDGVAKNRQTLVVMTHGELIFYNDRPTRGKLQDPTLGLMHQLIQSGPWSLSLAVSLKPPLTRTYEVFQSGWDHAINLSTRWRPVPRHDLHAGLGYVKRPRGSRDYNQLVFGAFRSGWGAHLGWEYRRHPRIRPFLQLYALSGQLPPQPHQQLHRMSLQHDLGCHWQLRRNLLLTFRYLNNITHHENTADMGLGLSLTSQF